MTENTTRKRKTKTKREPAEAIDILSLLNKQWASNNDIALIAGVGLNKAAEDRKKIEESIKKKYGPDCRLPAAKVPMEEVVEYYNINISYLRKIAKLNSEINNI